MINKEQYALGQKIRNFRKRANKSQMELELEIDASPGSLSRIENGEVNPTKETLMKLIDVLNLNSIEASIIFGIETTNISNILSISKDLYDSKNIDEILQKSVDGITYELNLLAGFITLVKEDRLFAQTTTRNLITEVALKVIGVPLSTLSIDMNNNDNLMVRCVNTKQIVINSDHTKFLVPAISKVIANITVKLTGAKSGIALPIILDNNAIGAIYFGKNYIDNFEREIPILKAFTEYIASAIKNTI
ncbi:MAG: helix-turn-helix domain-containing protein [Candidatus Dojkabacteria bacterium]